jgi:biotin carboxylase
MIPPIQLIIADNMAQGKEVARAAKLDLDSCAVITKPSYLDPVSFYENETVYVHANSSSELYDELNYKIKASLKNINIKIVQ